jgi:Bacterial regulatory proteins, gntR family
MPPRSQPKRDQIIQWVEQQMHDGQLRDGTQLPSVLDIAARFGVSHDPVQRALEQLRTKGLIYTIPGGGTFASPGRLTWGPQQQMRAVRYPYGQRIEVRAAALVEAPRYVAGLVGTSMVVRREWLTYKPAEQLPVMLSVSWCPAWAAAEVPELTALWPLPNPAGAAAMIAEARHEPLTWGWCAWENRLPRNDGRETSLLHLDPGVFVSATVISWGSGDAETKQTTEYTEMVTGPNRVLEAELVP